MIAAPIPEADVERVAALRSLGLLETGAEDRFDRITRIATAALRVPIAFVSLIDTDQQVFKSCVGMPGEAGARSDALCGYTILSDEPMVVEDARVDERFADNPYVVGEPGIVFYVGRPLHEPATGARVGALCVVDRRPRSVTAEELAVLDDLARLVEAELDRGELSRLVAALDESRAALRRVQQRDELILRSIDAGVVGIDEHGVVTFANRSAEVLLGWPPGSLVGRPLHDTAHHHRRDGRPYDRRDCPTMRTLRDGVASRTEGEWLWRADGGGFPAEIGSAPKIDGGRVVGAVVTFLDTTERDQVRALKAEFVALVSHELRTPLTSVSGALRLLSAGVVGELPDEAQELVVAAEANAARLIRLVNDILDLERLEQRRFDLAMITVDAAAVVDAAIGAVAEVARDAGVTVTAQVASETSLVGDVDRLVQVLTNLIGNAVKFSERGTEVTVSADLLAVERLRFRVQDQGRGIPPDKLETIFEPFAQVDASDSRRHGGTGLGLAITARLVEAHGGTIDVRSTPGAGSTFDVVLPTGTATGRTS